MKDGSITEIIVEDQPLGEDLRQRKGFVTVKDTL